MTNVALLFTPETSDVLHIACGAAFSITTPPIGVTLFSRSNITGIDDGAPPFGVYVAVSMKSVSSKNASTRLSSLIAIVVSNNGRRCYAAAVLIISFPADCQHGHLYAVGFRQC